MLASRGYRAVATASAAVSASPGFEDGEKIARSTMLEIVRRISRAVAVPVTADMEAGYGSSLAEVQDMTRCLVDTGAVGLNLEDSLEEGGALRPMDEQAERIAAMREAAAEGLDLVINAPEGADCIYPIGPGDAETLTVLRSRIILPLNALANPDAAPMGKMAAIGINRVSFGPFIFRSCLRKFEDIADALSRSADYECFGREMMTGSEVAAYLSSNREDAAERR